MLALSPNNLDAILKIADRGKKQFQLLAGDVLYDQEIFKTSKPDAFDGMVVAVSFHVKLANNNFTQKANELWGTGNVSWRTLSSYDAAKTFFQALTSLTSEGNQNPSREDLYKKLENISVPGATAKVEFNSEHDRKRVKGVGVLVQAKGSDNSRDEYSFIPLNTPERNNY